MELHRTRPFTRLQLNILRIAAAHTNRNYEYAGILSGVKARGLIDPHDKAFDPFDTPPDEVDSEALVHFRDCVDMADERHL
jgi:hypothetical protein